jgi:hypothetical protein
MRFGCVPPPVQIWAVVGPLLAPSLARGGDTIGDVIDAVESGTAQLWIAHEGDSVRMAGVTTRSGAVCHVWQLAGRDWRGWLKLATETLKDAAREGGCTRITIDGRKGWQRLLAPYGFTAAGELLEADL